MSAFAQPKLRSSDFAFAEEMQALPDFLQEAIAEEADIAAMSAALVAGDAMAVVEVINAASEKYANFLIDAREPEQSVSARMEWLRELYA